MQTLRLTAPAKVNLFLGVGGRRSDGYHDVSTVLHTLTLADTVTLTPSENLCLTCHPEVGVPAQKNLAFLAADAFSRTFDIDVLIDIHIEKRIPSGAGLGGGSSDAAAVLAGLAYWASLPLHDPRLTTIAESLGADVPFFLTGGAVTMTGRGDAIGERLASSDAPVVLVKPQASVSTAEAYRAFDERPQAAGDSAGVLQSLIARDPQALGSALSNNMEAASTGLVPEIAHVLKFLRADNDVFGAAMAGSGSGCFAICRDEDTVSRLAEQARERGWWAHHAALSPTGVRVLEAVATG
jgi:4-diphosphocytidyl-2-C-methyl-D-erythritol kinase